MASRVGMSLSDDLPERGYDTALTRALIYATTDAKVGEVLKFELKLQSECRARMMIAHVIRICLQDGMVLFNDRHIFLLAENLNQTVERWA